MTDLLAHRNDRGLYWAGLTVFTALGLWALIGSFGKNGRGALRQTIRTAAQDPLIGVSMADFGFLITLTALWAKRDAQIKNIRFAPWIPAFYFLGSPAVCAYLLYSSGRPWAKEEDSSDAMIA